MKRQLTKEEKELTEKNLLRSKSRIEVLEYYIAYERLILEQGLKINYEEQIKAHELRLKELAEEKEDLEFAIEISEKQLTEGVDDGN